MSPPTLLTEHTSARTKIVVISLANAVESCFRLKETARHSAPRRRTYPAGAGANHALKDLQEDEIVASGRRVGELRVSSSHYTAWQDLKSDDADQYFVLEDNLIVDWSFLDKLSTISLSRMGIDYLRLHYRYPARTKLVKENFIEPNRSIIELDGTDLGAQAYAITKAGAALFLEQCRIERKPIHDSVDRARTQGQRHLSIFPFPVIQESVDESDRTQLQSLIVPRESDLRKADRPNLRRRDTSPAKGRFDRLSARWRT